MIETAAAQKILGLIPVKSDIMLIIEAVFAPKIRNTAFCRNARSAKESDVFGLLYDLVERLILFFSLEGTKISRFFSSV